MSRALPEFKKGQPVSAGKLTTLRDELEILSKLRCESPLEMIWTAGGPMIRLNQAGTMWAMLLKSERVPSLCSDAADGMRTGYSWQQLDFDSDKRCFRVADPGRTGDHEQNTAFEYMGHDFDVNNNPEGPIKDVVILWPGFQSATSPEWLFSRPPREFIWVALMIRTGNRYEGILMEPSVGGGGLGKNIPYGCPPSGSQDPTWCNFKPVRPVDRDGRTDPSGQIDIKPLYN
jgi:hypothetical protein